MAPEGTQDCCAGCHYQDFPAPAPPQESQKSCCNSRHHMHHRIQTSPCVSEGGECCRWRQPLLSPPLVRSTHGTSHSRSVATLVGLRHTKAWPGWGTAALCYTHLCSWGPVHSHPSQAHTQRLLGHTGENTQEERFSSLMCTLLKRWVILLQKCIKRCLTQQAPWPSRGPALGRC